MNNKFNIKDLNNEETGLVPFIFEAEKLLSDPEIFVLSSDLSDVTKLNYGNGIASSGSGAGLSYNDAYFSTLGECAERYALSIYHPDDLIFGSYKDLEKKYSLSQPDEWKLFDLNQLPSLPFTQFDEDSKISWVQAESLTYRQPKLVPACLTYMPYKPINPGKGEIILAPTVSTGAACATSLIEATAKGIWELIERDAFMISWRNVLKLPRIIIDEKSPLYDLYTSKFVRPQLEYYLFLTTMDLKLPSVFGILIYTDANGKRLAFTGGACHPDPEKAVLKTLLELVQGLKWGEYVDYNNLKTGDNFADIRTFKDRMVLYSSGNYTHVFDFLIKQDKSINLTEIESHDLKAHKQNLRHVIEILQNRNLEVLSIDVTPIDINSCGLKVVKVHIPGIENMEGDFNWQFLGGTRWRNVPFELGLTRAKIDLGEENPYPHPYP